METPDTVGRRRELGPCGHGTMPTAYETASLASVPYYSLTQEKARAFLINNALYQPEYQLYIYSPCLMLYVPTGLAVSYFNSQ